VKLNEKVHIENDISYAVRGAAFKVNRKLGPGLLESVYETALTDELRREGFDVKTQIGIPMVYNEQRMDVGFRLDILVNDLVIVEVKSVETLAEVHQKTLLTYLRLTEKKLGLLINFNTVSLKDSIIRIVNQL
jgi:GxxExxY protein